MDIEHAQLTDGTIRNYLLSRLPPDDTERLDELSVADGAFFDRMRAVEDDLVDSFIRGEMPADARIDFEINYLRSPARRERVEFARSLRTFASQAASARRSSGLAAVIASSVTFFSGRGTLALGTAAAALIIGAAIYFSLPRPERFEAAVPEVAMPSSIGGVAKVDPVPSPDAAPGAPAASPAAVAEPAPFAGDKNTTPSDGRQKTSPTPKISAPRIATLIIGAQTRSTSVPTLKRGNADAAFFRLESDSKIAGPHDVTLLDLETRRVVFRRRITAAKTATGSVYRVTVPARGLRRRMYNLTVSTPGPDAEIVGDYSFRVVQ